MPDLDELLAERLARPITVVPPPLGNLQRRAARRRQRRLSLLAAGAAAVVAVVVAAPTLPSPFGAPDVAGYASGSRDGVLDAGTGRDGDWRVVVSHDGDGWCVKGLTATLRGGACGLAAPGRLGQASQFPNWDGDEFIVVLAGPAPPGTTSVRATAQGITITATVKNVDGGLFWSARVPPGAGETRAVAYDAAGAVIDQFYWPPIPASAPTGLPVPQLVPGCALAVNAETGERTCTRG